MKKAIIVGMVDIRPRGHDPLDHKFPYKTTISFIDQIGLLIDPGRHLSKLFG